MQNHLGHKGLCYNVRNAGGMSRWAGPAGLIVHDNTCWIFGRNWLKERKLGIYQQIIDLQVSKTNENSATLVKYTRAF